MEAPRKTGLGKDPGYYHYYYYYYYYYYYCYYYYYYYHYSYLTPLVVSVGTYP